MRLTRVTVDGLKNLDRADIAIPPLLAVHGDNGTGKSALRQAITLATQGYDYAIGKRLQDTRQLLDDDAEAIRVAVTFDSGFGIRRSVGESMDVDVVPDRGERTIAQAEARIKEETGAFPYVFDLGPFLELSSEKRKEALFALLPRELGNVEPETFRKFLGYDESDDPIQRAIDHIWTEHVLRANTAVEGLTAAIKFANEHANKATAARQAQEKVVRAAEADAIRASSSITFDEHALPRLQAEISSVEQELGELRERETAAFTAAERNRRREQERDLLEVRDRDVVALIGAAAERLDALKQKTYDLEVLRATAERAQKRAHAQRDAVTATASREVALQADLRSATKTLQSAEQLHNTLAIHEKCPTCGGTEDLAAAKARAAEAVESARATVQMMLGQHQVAEQRAQAAAADQRERDQVAAAAAGELQTAEQHARDLERAQQEIERITDQRKSIEVQLLKLKQQTTEEVPAIDHARAEELNARASQLRTQIREQQELAKQAGAAQADRERATRERTKLEQLAHKEGALIALHGGLQKLRTRVIRSMVGPVEKQANELLQSIDPAKAFVFQFEREERDQFDFGFVQDARFRGFDAASKGEKAFLAVVFVAALVAAVQPSWRALLIDDFEAIARERRRWLMTALVKASHLFDNIILCGCPDTVPSIEGWTVKSIEELLASDAHYPQLAAV